MKVGSLFSGIGGFDLGFERAGFQTIWQVEKEPFCIAVLKSHFPDAERYYDVLKCGHDRKHKLRAVDVLTAGFPCQDLSVAGKRAGLEGSRSGLFWEVVRILGELRPAWFVLENVPGLFSSGEGRDFAIVLNALDELGYGVAWRVLNSQFFGVAQRRRRVFIVGCFGKPCPSEVLFEPEGGGGDIAESAEEGPDIAVPLTSGIGITGNAPGRRREDDFNLAVGFQNTGQGWWNDRDTATTIRTPEGSGSLEANLVASPLTASHAKQLDSSDRNGGPPNIVQQAISSKWAKGSSGPAGEHHNLTVVNCLSPVGGRPDDNDAQAGHLVSAPSHTNGGIGQGHNTTYIQASEYGVREYDKPGALRADRQSCGEHAIFDERAPADSNGVRDFAGLPEGMDSARYRALGNAVTVQVAYWIATRMKPYG